MPHCDYLFKICKTNQMNNKNDTNSVENWKVHQTIRLKTWQPNTMFSYINLFLPSCHFSLLIFYHHHHHHCYFPLTTIINKWPSEDIMRVNAKKFLPRHADGTKTPYLQYCLRCVTYRHLTALCCNPLASLQAATKKKITPSSFTHYSVQDRDRDRTMGMVAL